MKNKQKNHCLWPQGREWCWIVGISVIVIISGYYTFYVFLGKIDYDYNVSHQSTIVKINPTEAERVNTEGADVEIQATHLPKNGIPTLNTPRKIPGAQANWLQPEERVVGIVVQNTALAYPLRILAYHECINDSKNDIHFAVTFCPLCDCVNVWNREVNGEVLEFGITGMLYQSNILLFDRQPSVEEESLWCQLEAKAIAGPYKGKKLETISYQLMSWQQWKQKHPKTYVLSQKTGYFNEYNPDFFPDYYSSDELLFPVNHKNNLLSPKERIVGVLANGVAKAYPIELVDNKVKRIVDSVGGEPLVIERLSSSHAMIQTTNKSNAIHCLWFSWYTFHPDTEIYDGPGLRLQQLKNGMRD